MAAFTSISSDSRLSAARLPPPMRAILSFFVVVLVPSASPRSS